MSKKLNTGLVILCGFSLLYFLSPSDEEGKNNDSIFKSEELKENNPTNINKKTKSQKSFIHVQPPSVETVSFPEALKRNHIEQATALTDEQAKQIAARNAKKDPQTAGVVRRSISSKKEKKEEKPLPELEQKRKATPRSVASVSEPPVAASAPAPVFNNDIDDAGYWYKRIMERPTLETITIFLSAYKSRIITEINFLKVLDGLILNQRKKKKKAALIISGKTIGVGSFNALIRIKKLDKSLEESADSYLNKYLSIDHVNLLKTSLQNNKESDIVKEIIEFVVLSAKTNEDVRLEDSLIYSDLYSPFATIISELHTKVLTKEDKDFYKNQLDSLNRLIDN